jgi:murein L,D-transpeptidase YcbB/YkuD
VLCGASTISAFYGSRGFQPAWTNHAGARPQATELVKAIRHADFHGLTPDDYHLETIEAILQQTDAEPMEEPEPGLLADLDLLLTDAYLLYGSHLLSGRVNPEDIQPKWNIGSREEDLARILQNGLDENRVWGSLEELAPRHEKYAALQQALQQHRAVLASGGWIQVPSGSKMEIGYRGMRVALLRSRLRQSGDLGPEAGGEIDRYDAAIDQAVRRFQARHGLASDGVVGSATLQALNKPTILRVEQIRVNLERWRWLPLDLGQRFVVVNIADFHLDLVEDGNPLMRIRVVTGRPYRHTPVFSGTMTYLEVNPYWHIPPSIARKDILPKIKKNPDYLAEQGIRVFESWKSDAGEIDPNAVDWSRITPRTFSYKLRQDPGPRNALGRIKFMFPNRFSVYLHDTPAKGLFDETRRTFSSGCVRVERPMDLADFVLDGDPLWTRDALQAAIESGETRTMRLPKPLPVHILYWTAWIDEEGRIQFRKDVYGRDKELREALKRPAPGVSAPVFLHEPY